MRTRRFATDLNSLQTTWSSQALTSNQLNQSTRGLAKLYQICPVSHRDHYQLPRGFSKVCSLNYVTYFVDSLKHFEGKISKYVLVLNCSTGQKLEVKNFVAIKSITNIFPLEFLVLRVYGCVVSCNY